MILVILKKIIFGLILGIIGTITLLQYDARVQEIILTGFKQAFEETLDCKLECSLKSLNLFIPRITLKNVRVTPKSGKSWHWQADIYETSFSWLHLFFRGTINLGVVLDRIVAESELVDNHLAIVPHMQRMLIGPCQVPLFVKSIALHYATFTAKDPKNECAYSLSWHSSSKKIDQTLKSYIQCLNGFITYKEKKYLEDLKGTIDFDVIENIQGMPKFQAQSSLATIIHFDKPLTCFLHGSWNQTQGSCSIKTDNPLLEISKCTLALTNNAMPFTLQGQLPLSFLNQIYPNKYTCDGFTQIQLTANASDFFSTLRTKIDINRPTINACTLAEDMSIHLQAYENDIHANAKVITPYGTLLSEISWNKKNKVGNFNLTNQTALTIPGVPGSIQPKNMVIQGTGDQNDVNSFHTIIFDQGQKKHHLQGNATYNNGKGAVTGSCNSYHYNATLESSEVKLSLKQDNNTIVTLSSDFKSCQGSLSLNAFSHFLSTYSFYKFPLCGDMHYQITMHNGIHAILELKNGALRIPYTYNHIKNAYFDASFDQNYKKIIIHSAKAQLATGSFEINRASLWFDPLYNLYYAHIPLIFNSCLLNIKKGIFGKISGSLIGEQKPHQLPCVTGSLIIDQAQLKENILSPAFISFVSSAFSQSSAFTAPALDGNITIETKDPIRIKTSVLNTAAQCNMHILGKNNTYSLAGAIKLSSGQLMFPYKPLYITKAQLIFLPQASHNPSIELVAKNTVKKHLITLQVTGTLESPQVVLESSPPLSEDQIVGLLMVGSHENSLNTAVPAFIVQNVKDLIFQKDQSPIQLTEQVKKILKPLKRVHVIPRLSDQTGRGGLRAALDIDVTDRLSVSLQKNFTLTEDTRLEVEYMLSDDITLRAVRDERKDVDGEVEVKFKF